MMLRLTPANIWLVPVWLVACDNAGRSADFVPIPLTDVREPPVVDASVVDMETFIDVADAVDTLEESPGRRLDVSFGPPWVDVLDVATSEDAAGFDGERFAVVEPGWYLRGSHLHDPSAFPEEAPRSVVHLTRQILVSRYEVTQGEWQELVGTNPSYFTACGPDCPVERVNHWEALEYLNLRSRADQLPPCYVLENCRGTFSAGCDPDDYACDDGYVCDSVTFLGLDCPGWRLPTEAEQNYYTRAGSDGQWQGVANSEAELRDYAWTLQQGAVSYDTPYECVDIGGASECGTVSVGNLRPNAWGLYDTTGNVWEWGWDYYSTSAVSASVKVDPVWDVWNTQRVLHGCSYTDSGETCRLGARGRIFPGRRDSNKGFRMVRTLSGSQAVQICPAETAPDLRCFSWVGGRSADDALRRCRDLGGTTLSATNREMAEFLAVRAPANAAPALLLRRSGGLWRDLNGGEVAFRWWLDGVSPQGVDCGVPSGTSYFWRGHDCGKAVVVACQTNDSEVPP